MMASPSPHAKSDGQGASTRMSYTQNGRAILSQDAVELLRGRLSNESKEAVSDALGISSNTWIKVKRGMPVTASLARRLVERIGG